MINKLKRILIGKPLKNEVIKNEKYSVFWGLPILASDAISSVAYASQEILLVLYPAIGYLAFTQMTYISAAIIGLLVILTLSYRQTIEEYPNGGGAYIVAKENIGTFAGIIAGAALAIDYVLTVAVSISSGVEQIVSAFPQMKSITILLCILLVLLLAIGNLRGLRESARLFGIPAYAFIIGMVWLIIAGFIRYVNGYVPIEVSPKAIVEPITIILILRAFSNGCAAVTGIEAVSNAVPNFKEPARKNAKKVMLFLAIIIVVLFGGTSILANLYHIVPGEKAVIINLAEQIFGRDFMFYYVTATIFTILVLAANTAYSGFPLLVSIMAREGYLPRQFDMRGDRLNYSNGIIILTLISSLLIIGFNAKVTSLIGLYAIGVFISFTLSQTGMFLKWIRSKQSGWVNKAWINGLGAITTGVAVIVIAISKFGEGAWLVVFLIPIFVAIMVRIKNHYTAINLQLKCSHRVLNKVNKVHESYDNIVIVPVQSINKASIQALRYAKTISRNVIAFHVATDEEDKVKMQEMWTEADINVKLEIRYSPYRKIVEPLLKFVRAQDCDYSKGETITVILPQFVVNSWWQWLLHNQTRLFIERELLKQKHLVVATMPLQLKGDEVILEHGKRKK